VDSSSSGRTTMFVPPRLRVRNLCWKVTSQVCVCVRVTSQAACKEPVLESDTMHHAYIGWKRNLNPRGILCWL
jgi:hypothetical protein